MGGDDVDLTSRVGGVTLPNPVMTASGTAGYGIELAPYLDLASLGAVVVKSLSAAPWAGNPAPRVHQSGAGMLNSVGLQNPGVDPWLAEELPALAAARARVVVSVWGFSTAAYEQVGATIARAVAGGASGSGGGASGTGGGAGRSGAGVSGAPGAAIVAVEANISCPNVEDRSNVFAHSCAGTQAAVQATARGLDGALPLWVKLSPNVTDLPAIAGAALGAGASALVLTNTLMGMALDPATGRSRLGAGGGGLSGPALHPVAVRAVYDCRAAHPAAPIVGVGGVATGEDAAELLAAGADAVQVGTASFADPRAPARVLSELAGWCRRHGVSSLADLVGRAHRATC
ncbi:MAG TPA: dihydroorotate dehydrogenase [Acidimicrobiales bacterium]|nr:dihydroorotate dehydrogenase [Acidimicrobiales bacterium]